MVAALTFSAMETGVFQKQRDVEDSIPELYCQLIDKFRPPVPALDDGIHLLGLDHATVSQPLTLGLISKE